VAEDARQDLAETRAVHRLARRGGEDVDCLAVFGHRESSMIARVDPAAILSS